MQDAALCVVWVPSSPLVAEHAGHVTTFTMVLPIPSLGLGDLDVAASGSCGEDRRDVRHARVRHASIHGGRISVNVGIIT